VNNSLELIEGGGVESYDSDVEEGEEGEEQELSPEEKEKSEKSKKRVLILVALMAVLYLFIGDDNNNAPTKTEFKGKTFEKDPFAESLRKKQSDLDEEQKLKLKTILNRGLRELREKNYSRAIEEFNLALVLSPNEGRAQFYLSKANQKLFEAVDNNLIKAKREEEALKYNAAIVSYCDVIRLLRKYPDHDNYKDAQKGITDLEEKMGLPEGQINCLKSGEF
jgi:tetratricopeptide (TPR) repeat protein